MKQKTLILLAAVLMAGGLWWQFAGRNTDTATQPAEASEAETAGDVAVPQNPSSTSGSGDSGPVLVPGGPELVDDFDSCQPVQGGFGIEMKEWGPLRLPYADRWPKNEPGTPVDCAPESDFGAAVVAAHSLYLEGASPELIPAIAKDTPGRELRLEQDREKTDVDTLVRGCEPLGWDKPQQGISVWLIYHQCDGFPIDVTPMRMEYTGETWLMVYDITGRISIEEAPPATQYFPFESGDV